MKEMPKPTRQMIPVERLTFDSRHQMRALTDTGMTYDPDYVKDLLEARELGAAFPPLSVVEEPNYKGKKESAYFVFDGFNRGEMLRRAEVPSTECMVYPGTWLDAKRWAMRVNSSHGRSRGPADTRRVFEQFITDDAIREDVLSGAKSEGGIYRAIQLATGLSQGALTRYFPEFGWTVDRIGGKGQLRRIETPPPVVLTQADIAEVDHVLKSTVSKRTSKARKAAAEKGEELLAGYVPAHATPEKPEAAEQLALTDLEELRKQLAKTQRLFDRLILSPYQSRLVVAAKAHGVPIAVMDSVSDSAGGSMSGGSPQTAAVWNWEALRAMSAATADVHGQIIAAAISRGITD
jgi:hypothetical protein